MADAVPVILFLAAALFGSSSGAAQPPAGEPPLRLVAELVGTGIRLQVIGNSIAACEAHYELDVTGDSVRGGNRSIQRGTARLSPGVPATLATVTLASVNPDGWSAKLSVHPCGGERYEQVRGSGA